MNAAGKEASPAIPSPAFYVWGAPSSENMSTDNSMGHSNYHASNITETTNQIRPNASSLEAMPKTAQKIPAIPECYDNLDASATIEEISPPQVISQSPPINMPSPINDDAANFPSLGGNDNFPSLSAAATVSAPPKGKGKKGRGKKGQQILTLGVQRMSIT